MVFILILYLYFSFILNINFILVIHRFGKLPKQASLEGIGGICIENELYIVNWG